MGGGLLVGFSSVWTGFFGEVEGLSAHSTWN